MLSMMQLFISQMSDPQTLQPAQLALLTQMLNNQMINSQTSPMPAQGTGSSVIPSQTTAPQTTRPRSSTANSKSSIFGRRCCGGKRSFDMQISDNLHEPVLTMKRPFKIFGGCQMCACLGCAQDEITVSAANGEVLGYVKQAFSVCKPHLMILDSERVAQYEIWGPKCPFPQCNSKMDFPVKCIGEKKVMASINRLIPGTGQREYLSDADTFNLTFPVDLDVKMKATLLGAVFLIDFMFLENTEAVKVRR